MPKEGYVQGVGAATKTDATGRASPFVDAGVRPGIDSAAPVMAEIAGRASPWFEHRTFLERPAMELATARSARARR